MSSPNSTQSTHSFKTLYIFPVIGVILLCVSGFLYWDQSQFLAHARSAEGEIIGFFQSTRDGERVYAPEVSYIDSEGVEQEFVSDVTRPVKTYPIGDKVEVLYSEDGSVQRIKSFYELWFLTFITSAMGLIFTLFGSYLVIQSRKYDS